MTTEAALLQAIAERPEDDDLRRVYADSFDDHGQAPRAEFIRLQLRLARITGADPETACEPRPLAAHKRELLGATPGRVERPR